LYYDELQNLSGESLPSPEEIFGKKPDGTPRVQFHSLDPGRPRTDILLEKCYRNSRPVLVTAHALGFGIYRSPPKEANTGLVQMFDHPGLWEEVGYRVKNGRLEEGAEVVLERTDETSPKFLEEHSQIDDLVQFHKFQSEEDQANWLIKDIQRNLDKDELRHDDIIVINPDPISTRNKVGPIRKMLYEKGINSHLAGVDTDPDIFFQPSDQSITFTGVHRAKGNEAGMVYYHQCSGLSVFHVESGQNPKSIVHRHYEKQGLG
jgi:superfamily I DNA and RNA helicase